jgi:hypothetical protein
MMIRGRHRGLPYALDRAITLPSDLITEEEPDKSKSGGSSESESGKQSLVVEGRKMVKAMTQ